MSHVEFDFHKVKAGLDKHEVIVIDVRGDNELRETGKLPKSRNVPLPELYEAFATLSPDEFEAKYGFPRPPKDIGENMIITCRSGRRVEMAVEELQKIGYQGVGAYKGSFLDWQANGGPIEPHP